MSNYVFSSFSSAPEIDIEIPKAQCSDGRCGCRGLEHFSRLHHVTWLGIDQRSTLCTSHLLLVSRESLHRSLDLRAQIRAVERSLMHDGIAGLAVPAEAVEALLWARLFQHNPDCFCEPYRVVRRVRREQEHFAFADVDVAEVGARGRVDDTEKHPALVLVEPLGCLVDVVVCAGVGATDDLLQGRVNRDRNIKKACGDATPNY